MKIFTCKVCSYVAFEQAPVDCPVCRAPIENFEHKPEIIRTPQNPTNLNDFEKRHTPMVIVSKNCNLITGSCADITVRVGEIEHLMDNEHYICCIDFYFNKRYVSRLRLTYKRIYPAVTVRLNITDGGTLTVVSHCTQHGSWMAEINNISNLIH